MVVRRTRPRSGFTRAWSGVPVLCGGALVAAALVVAVAQPAAAAGPKPMKPSTSTGVRTAGSGTISPEVLLAASLDAARAESSVHYVATSAVGDESVRVTADSATAAASQEIVLRVGKGIGHVTARLVDSTAYFRGNALGLEDYLGMPSRLAPKYVGRWISFSSSTKSYPSIAKSMSVSSAINQISVDAPLSGSRKVSSNGRSAVSIRGTTTSLSSAGNKGTAVLYVSATGRPLPIAYRGTGEQKKKPETGTVTYSRWGEAVSPRAPATSVPSSSIAG
jgi:hypothetical protein